MLRAVLLIALTFHATEALQSAQVDQPSSRLATYVEQYFLTDDAGRRDELIRSIEQAADDSVAAVASAVRNARLWWKPTDGSGAFTFIRSSGEALRIAFDLPADYDPGRRYPLLVVLRPESGIAFTPGDLRGYSLLPPGPFVIVSPDEAIGLDFHSSPEASTDFTRLMREIRRRFSIDVNRSYAYGVARGADAAWLAAILYSNEFAGAFCKNGSPPIPYPEQTYPMFLTNLRGRFVVSILGKGRPARPQSTDFLNELVLSIARRESLPVAGIHQPMNTSALSPRDLNDLANLLAHPRRTPSPTVSHLFRYPAQGRADWLRLVEFRGEVWMDEQLSILPNSDSDRDAFITAVIRDKLGFLGGRIDGQTIRIRTRRCARIDVLFYDGMVDWDLPVTIHINGARRFRGKIKPDIPTLLKEAYATWDLDRLVFAKRSFAIRRDDTE